MVNTKITDLVQTVAELDKASRQVFVKGHFGAFGEKDRSRLVQWVCHCAYPKTRWSKVERWMEGQFMRDMNKTPRKTASIALSYFRINPKMLPFLCSKTGFTVLKNRAPFCRVRGRMYERHPRELVARLMGLDWKALPLSR